MNLFVRIINKLKRVLLLTIRIIKGKIINIRYFSPNYIYRNNLSSESVVVDVGCADDADFSVELIKRYNLRAYGVDPTRKHKSALKLLEKKYDSKFIHIERAVSSISGNVMFYESKENVSGSLCDDHSNIVNDTVISYEVPSVTLGNLAKEIKHDKVDILKLDLEGAEYDLLMNARDDDFSAYQQIFIEFHHRWFSRFSEYDTINCIKKLKRIGYKIYTRDRHNCLFYK